MTTPIFDELTAEHEIARDGLAAFLGATEARITSTSMPNQIEGRLRDGRYFYFRARHGSYSLGYGATPDEAMMADDGPDGDDTRAGWWSIPQASLACRRLLEGQA